MSCNNGFRRHSRKPPSYRKTVGPLLMGLIAELMDEWGFRTEVNVADSNDVGIKVYLNGSLILVAEVLNWSIGSWLSGQKTQQIIDNLSQYNNGCRRALFSSVQAWESTWWASRNGISLVCIGFQVLTPEHYAFFENEGRVEQRRSLNADTRDEVRNVIRRYLEGNGLL